MPALAGWIVIAAALGQGAGDYSAGSLRREVEQVENGHAHRYRDVPLDVKAQFFEWQLWRYHINAGHQAANVAQLAEKPGVAPLHPPRSDTSTWNGALLAALSYKYRVTRDPETLRRIAELVEGLRLFFRATGQPGLPARSMTELASLANPGMREIELDGRRWHVLSDPAKGTMNQIAAGYATLLMHVEADLPVVTRDMARADAAAMALHLLKHEYRLTESDGRATTHGELVPLLGTTGVPFHAQVAYQIMALAQAFPPEDPAAREQIAQEFQRLRAKHHVYYENPLRSLVQPQRVAASPFVKGMNDRNHAMGAAFVGLELESHVARREGRDVQSEFVYQLGQTLCFGMQRLAGEKNALCNFQWAALVYQPKIAAAMLSDQPLAQRVAQQGLLDGVEQLRRFRLSRFFVPGKDIATREPQWVDRRMVDEYAWKADPRTVWEPSGPAGNDLVCAIDYLHAYWLMRYFQLENHPLVREHHAAVLKESPNGTTTSPADGFPSRAQSRK